MHSCCEKKNSENKNVAEVHEKAEQNKSENFFTGKVSAVPDKKRKWKKQNRNADAEIKKAEIKNQGVDEREDEPRSPVAVALQREQQMTERKRHGNDIKSE